MCKNAHSKNAHEHTGSAETLRPSLRNGFTAYIVLSPARPGLFVTVTPKKRELPKNLTPAIGASGPHDFAVRERLRSSFANSASTASHPACRDVRNAPLVGWDGNRSEADLPSRSTVIRCDTLARRANQQNAVKIYLIARRQPATTADRTFFRTSARRPARYRRG